MSKATDQLDSIWAAARQAAAAGRCVTDRQIPASEFGYGQGVSVLAIPDEAVKGAIAEVRRILEPLDPDQYWYASDRLHITLHGVAWRERGGLPSETEFMRLRNALNPAFVGAGYPQIALLGPIVFPGTERQIGTVSIQAIPNCDLLLLRDRVRQCVMDAGYPDRRNYAFGRGDYLTCTVARLRKQPSSALIAKVGELRGAEIARFYLTEALLTVNSYFFSPERTEVRERFAII